jgi:YD repeat-containing protein
MHPSITRFSCVPTSKKRPGRRRRHRQLNSARTAIGGALIVKQLGRWVAAGNSQYHQLEVVDAATATHLPGAVTNVNTAGAAAGAYLYQALPNPVQLQAAHGYYLMSQETYGADQWYQDTTTLTPSSDLTVTNAVWWDGSSYNPDEGANNSYVPPNFIYGLDQPAITGQSLTYLQNDFTGTVGFAFTTAPGTPVRQMQWTLDATGNWSQYVTQTSGTTDLNQSRVSNTVNEITNISESTGPAWVTPAYDPAGNMTAMPQVSDPTQSFTAVYDAWNRMVSISDSSGTVATYAYDGQNRRIIEAPVSGAQSGLYLDGSGNIVEERQASTMTAQYVWGIDYINNLVERDDSTGQSRRMYVLQDVNRSVSGTIDISGNVQERFLYDPYGSQTVMTASWIVTTDDYSFLYKFQGAGVTMLRG